VFYFSIANEMSLSVIFFIVLWHILISQFLYCMHDGHNVIISKVYYESTFFSRTYSYFSIWLPLKSIKISIIKILTMFMMNISLYFKLICNLTKLWLWWCK
jgi:hypothetical protein